MWCDCSEIPQFTHTKFLYFQKKIKKRLVINFVEAAAIKVYCDLLVKLFMSQAFCEEGNITENGVLAFCKYVLFPVMEVKAKAGKLIYP